MHPGYDEVFQFPPNEPMTVGSQLIKSQNSIKTGVWCRSKSFGSVVWVSPLAAICMMMDELHMKRVGRKIEGQGEKSRETNLKAGGGLA